MTSTFAQATSSLASTATLLSEIADAKRIRVASAPGSVAERAFANAWAELAAGAAAEQVARRVTAAAVVAVPLAGIDTAVLQRAGLDPAASREVLRRALDTVAARLDPRAREWVEAGLDDLLAPPATRPAAGAADPGLDAVDASGLDAVDASGPVPAFCAQLAAQPRAGATRLGHARLIVEPAESHADHCWATAVFGALLSPLFGADPAVPFVAGLAHHLYNAVLPDAGFASEMLLGPLLGQLMARLTANELATLPRPLAAAVETALACTRALDSPEARVFQAADVLDRVLQAHYHARAAAFTTAVALDELGLVHEGPFRDWHHEVLTAAGLLPTTGARA